jgi:chromosome segregation ATPase
MAVDMNDLKTNHPETYAYIQELRNEAAGHRTEAAEYKSKYTAATHDLTTVTGERDALKTTAETLTEAQRKAQRATWQTEAAKAAKLPENLASRLQGDDEAALKADAEALAKNLPGALSGRPPVDKGVQGDEFTGDGSGMDPDARALGEKLQAMLGMSAANN